MPICRLFILFGYPRLSARGPLANEAIARCIARVRARTIATTPKRSGSASAGLAAVEAAAAFGRGELAKCATILGPIIETATVVGGSDAQIELLRQTYLCSRLGPVANQRAVGYWRQETGKSKCNRRHVAWYGGVVTKGATILQSPSADLDKAVGQRRPSSRLRKSEPVAVEFR